jgi:hypothetical protein
MKLITTLLSALFLFGSGFAWAQSPIQETNCTDRKDNDGDSMVDCADADCFSRPECKEGGGQENTEQTCSDWIDNDGDGSTDCDDMECTSNDIGHCSGSADKKSGAGKSADENAAVPALGPGMSVEDLIGTGSDLDGERNDMLCSDGIDNDGDGRVDCADFGCKFDPAVNVCHGNPGMRFSIVASIAQLYDLEAKAMDTRFTKLQLRSFGPIYPIENSFYLVSIRAEKTPRFTFAMFQIPIGGGHYMNINSGGGGLSNALVISSSKQLLLDPPYYMYSAFEQGNGAAIEIGGPITSNNKLRYRVFGAGGSGRWAGNLGGRYFTYDNDNYTYSAGGQLQINLIGLYSRWDSPFLFTPAAPTLAIAIGGKYDQRAQERYPAANVHIAVRRSRIVVLSEFYMKRELEFGSWQYSYNVTAGFLVLPKRLMVAADFGQYKAGDMDDPPDQVETDIKKQRNETQWRVAAHLYFWQNIGVASVLYSDRKLSPIEDGGEEQRAREIRIVAQYRF